MPDAEFASSGVAADAVGQLFATGAFSFRHHLREANVVAYFSVAVSAVASAYAVITVVAELPRAVNGDAGSRVVRAGVVPVEAAPASCPPYWCAPAAGLLSYLRLRLVRLRD